MNPTSSYLNKWLNNVYKTLEKGELVRAVAVINENLGEANARSYLLLIGQLISFIHEEPTLLSINNKISQVAIESVYNLKK